ncbi:MAG: hypothetical protein ETSY2_45715 [Candidatus Entotheonella gemina]|uniref:Uncharacterized protein n=1 Tax=Candidatus Entotheonella gemina TaxID=1429439 RepID=W4LHN7_9BACT|nr:MAG: hypothetical protein ETSY2_45715 [Candidatus Entotheonella gemina]
MTDILIEVRPQSQQRPTRFILVSDDGHVSVLEYAMINGNRLMYNTRLIRFEPSQSQ